MDKIQNNQLAIYQTESGEIKVNVQIHDETVWLSLNQMAEIFERDKSVISRHLKNIFSEEELNHGTVVAKNATTAADGKIYQVDYYNLDAILSVGYRVNSKRGIEFRKWASKILKDYLIQGYSVNHDKATEERLNQLKQAIELLSTTLINQNLVNDTGKELLELIKAYAKTWDILIRYDEDNLNIPTNLQESTSNLLNLKEAREAILILKKELAIETNLFGLERDNTFKGILGNIDQTFDDKSLYKSAHEKAANLLYFIIKDHPFSDGNKRIGSLLFLLYLSKTRLSLKNMEVNAMTSLALLISESEPIQKELMIKLTVNLIN